MGLDPQSTVPPSTLQLWAMFGEVRSTVRGMSDRLTRLEGQFEALRGEHDLGPGCMFHRTEALMDALAPERRCPEPLPDGCPLRRATDPGVAPV